MDDLSSEMFFADFTVDPDVKNANPNGLTGSSTASNSSSLGSYTPSQLSSSLNGPGFVQSSGLRRVQPPLKQMDSFAAMEQLENRFESYQNYQQDILGIQQPGIRTEYSDYAAVHPHTSPTMSPSLGNYESPNPGFMTSSAQISMPSLASQPIPMTAYSPNSPRPYAMNPQSSYTSINLPLQSPLLLSPLAQSGSIPTSPSLNFSQSLPASHQMLLYYSQTNHLRGNIAASFRSTNSILHNDGTNSETSIGTKNGSDEASQQPPDKRERNRLAAERCRKKKADMINQLSIENQVLRQDASELMRINLALERKLDYVVNVLNSYGITLPNN